MENRVEERIQSWLQGPYDEKTKEEISRLLNTDRAALEDAFFCDLSFGTGGIRALTGVGTNRLNNYTISMITQGLANYLKSQKEGEISVFIGYDVRTHSRAFAEVAAKVLVGNGIKALVSKEVCPTPLVSFACRHFHCQAGIMITASHNPPEYNGYKVYWEGGAQVVSPHDKGIVEEVRKIKSPEETLLQEGFTEVGQELDIAYLKEIKKLQMLPEFSGSSLKIFYTNLHGTGLRIMQQALNSWGYKNFHFVEEQKPYDGNFSSISSPNPEDPRSLEKGLELLKQENGDLLLATDPDADRIGVATGQHLFSGNDIACICLEHICKTLKGKGEFPENAAFVKSIVTTELFRSIGESYGGKCIDVPTGFKYIANLIETWEKSFDSYQFLFGAEESYGYLFGTIVRDKDAILSGCLIAEVAARAKSEGKTLFNLLERIYQKHGVYRAGVKTLSFPNSLEGVEKRKHFMQHLREHPPKCFGGLNVLSQEDFLEGKEGFPPSDMILFSLEEDIRLIARPSGTEPKIKLYAEIKEELKESLPAQISSLDAKVSSLLVTLADHR